MPRFYKFNIYYFNTHIFYNVPICFSFNLFNMSMNVYLCLKHKLVENIGVEPMTSCVQGRRSSQLS